MKKILTALCVACVLFVPTIGSSKEDEHFLTGFLLGTYHLIGKSPDSENTYYGHATIVKTDEGLRITREIDGKTVHGIGEIEEPLCCEGERVLRIRFSERDIRYEETCLIDSDLDNYARLTCSLYPVDHSTERPGLEALFIDLSAE